MTRQSLAAIRQVFEVKQPAQMKEDGQALLIRVAREGIQTIVTQQTARAGVAPAVQVEVNGASGRAIDAVEVPGPIVATFDYRREIAEVGLDEVRKASPVQSGAYAANHLIMLNRRQVDQLPANLAPGDVVTIANPIVYARRIEIGKTKAGRDFLLQVPNRIYERVAKNILMPRYSAVARITFEYIEFEGAYQVKGKLSPFYLISETRQRRSKLGEAGSQKRRMRRQKPGTAIKAPAIVIRAIGR